MRVILGIRKNSYSVMQKVQVQNGFTNFSDFDAWHLMLFSNSYLCKMLILDKNGKLTECQMKAQKAIETKKTRIITEIFE